jgi:hypothetical protein
MAKVKAELKHLQEKVKVELSKVNDDSSITKL